MFKLQRLEITGFKSFADFTEIVFTGNGITAVVGPNGCGKSNVSDAISWVLGEQRPTSLRGQEMKDVVFQGTKKRNPSGMAEVVLHLVRDDAMFISDERDLEDIDERLGVIDEQAPDLTGIEPELPPGGNGEVVERQSGAAEAVETEVVKVAQVGSVKTVEKRVRARRRWRPRDFTLEFAPGEAVTVTRRLYLSGESEYLLNNKSCRLRDIQDLFSGTGLSGAHYAIVEQGRIGQILSAKPSNRRTLVEEAAGVSKFRMRQRAAESRLAAAKTNLGRISDIVSEIEKRTRSLKRQASKTRRYKILREELRELLKKAYSAEGKDLSALLEKLESELANATNIEIESVARVDAKEIDAREATSAARSAEENVTELRAKHAANALKRDRASREHDYQIEQIASLKKRAKALRDEIGATRIRAEELEKEIQRLAEIESEERGSAGEEIEKLTDAKESFEKKALFLRERETELEAERGEHLSHNAAVERLDEILHHLRRSLEGVSERIRGLELEHARAVKAKADREQEFSNLGKELDAGRERLGELTEERQEIIAVTERSKTSLEKYLSVLEKVSEHFAEKRHRLTTLKELEEQRKIYSPGVQRVFGAQEKIGVNFVGILADCLKVKKGAEAAIESLFAGNLQTILVRSEEDARTTIEYAQKHDLGRIRILVVGNNGTSRKSLDADGIEGLLGVAEDILAALRRFFPREMSARVVSDLGERDADLSRLRVTLAGDLAVGNGMFIAGKARSSEKQVSILSFKRELLDLTKETDELGVEIEGERARVDEARKKLAIHEDTLVDLQSLIVKVERELLSREIHLESVKGEIDRAERHKKVVEDEISQEENEQGRLLERIKKAERKSQTGVSLLQEASARIEEIVVAISESRTQVSAETERLNKRKIASEVATERERAAGNALKRVILQKEEIAERLVRSEKELSDSNARIGALEGSSGELALEIGNAEAEVKAERSELAEALEHLKRARTTSDSMSAELAELNKAAAGARNERAALEIRSTECSGKLANLQERCSEDLGLEFGQLMSEFEIGEGFDLPEAKDRVTHLRAKLDNFGAINMLAMEELGETEERLGFLSSQRQDVIDSIAAAEEALVEIKQRSRDRFLKAFEEINANFAEYFRELFGGGSGEMVLMESEDVLEAGVEIIAQPPGKRLQNLLLLSGGEKALTAIALVLAIFKFKPSPFCLLDEVDAPLDDANVARFVGRLEEMSEETQFIVITHNKRTMEAAKALYGVTMQERGVSKMVSVRFE